MRYADVTPDFGAVAASGELGQIIGALMTIVLVFSVMMLLISAAAWAVSASAGNYQGASRGRMGVLVSVLTALIAGGGIAWANFLIATGESL